MAEANTKALLNEAITLMQQVRNELNSVAKSARSYGDNVGEAKCALVLENLADDYDYAIRQIRKVV